MSCKHSLGTGKLPLEFLVAVLSSITVAAGQTSTGNPATFSIKGQAYQRAEQCLPCHQRQYDELRTAVKSGYRNVSPLFNSLELAGNFLSGGRLRPVYGDSTKISSDGTPLRSNLVSTKKFTHINQMQAGFCIGCHTPHAILMGEDPDKREIPELSGVGAAFQPGVIRPLRDFHLVDSSGRQILPFDIGGPAPPAARPSLGASGITCDVCHNVLGPDHERSVRRDGLANGSFELFPSLSRLGRLPFPEP